MTTGTQEFPLFSDAKDFNLTLERLNNVLDWDESSLPTFDLTDVHAKLKAELPTISVESENWLIYETDTFEIQFDLGNAKILMLHIHISDEPEDAALKMIGGLCRLLQCRAFDTAKVVFLET